MEPSRPRPRTIRIEDVVKALDIIAQRLGDGDRSCERLQAWAAEGRVTPAGQRLTPEAVAEGIQLWRAKAEPEAADRPPPTPLSSRRPSKREATQAGTSQAKEADARPDDRPKRRRRLKIMEESEPAAHSVDVAVDREACRAPCSFAERQAERKQREARLEELAETRFQELLAEIQGHMCEILRRSSSEALQEFRESTLTDPSERRELYMRLVHRQQAELRAPMQGLLPHQVEGLEWLVSLYINGLHGILADEMGLGKTIQSIALLLHLQDSGNLGPHLVVAPKSCLSNWQAEFERFAPDACVHLLAQAKESAAILRPDKVNVCITNYEQVYRNDWLLQRDWQLVIVDEGHRLKNPETLVHATMAKLRCRMRLLLTGTPLQNSVAELWALLHYLLPDLFTEMLDFKAWFAKPFRGTEENEYDVQLNPQQEQEVITQCHALLAPFLLQRLKSEVLGDSLPPRVEVTVRVPLSAWQSEAYADLKKKTIRWMEDDQICSEQVNNALMQLRKIALHPYLFQDDYPRDRNLFRVSGKVEALDRILAKLLRFKHKVLIFSQFTSFLNILEDYLRWKELAFVRLDGQVSFHERRERLKRFEDPDVPIFLLSSRAGGLGLNLQQADTVMLCDLDWNPQNDKQAIARVHRVGQTREVRVVRLLADCAVEHHMESRCAEKLEMEKKIMGAGMFRKASSEQRRSALREVLGLEPQAEQEHGLTSPEELSNQLARSEEEQKAFRSMDAALGVQGADGLIRCNRLMREDEVPQGFASRSI